jgi:DNA-binding response OmpR family regulator
MSIIWLIDDDPAYGNMIKMLLGGPSREIVVHGDIASASSAIKAEVPDLILLDVHMGQRNAGLDFLKELRSDERTRETPVILSSGDPAFEHRPPEDPHTDTMPKPFDPDDLVVKIEDWLSRSPGARRP